MCFKSRTSSSHPRSSLALRVYRAYKFHPFSCIFLSGILSQKGFSVTYTHTDGASSSAESRARVDIQRQSSATSFFFFFFFFFFSLLLFSSRRRRRRRNRNSMLRVDFGETRNERIRWSSFSRRSSSSFSPRACVGNGGNGVVGWRRGGGLSLRL